jgi:phytoene/squalene synthetase
MTNLLLQKAYSHCLEIAHNHYENFPVASRFLAKKIRTPVSVIYAFARNADDFADEGDLTTQQRLEYLDNYSRELGKIECNEQSSELVFIALKDVINRFQIPLVLFQNLLQAFKTDVIKTRYQTFTELLDYCRLSANPVGRILLYLHSADSQNASSQNTSPQNASSQNSDPQKSVTEENLIYSDALCTALQLINFYQDIAQDFDENARIYIPVKEMQRFKVKENDFAHKNNNANTKLLMDFQLNRAKTLYIQGKPLSRALSGRFGFELRMIYAGGYRVLHKLENNTADIYARPRLNSTDKLAIIRDALFKC